ncbi:hypothetical protein UFOVP134_27 [uncultured Caudovirales phage]|uniref:Uncharacterized protein n=1 Tax=uncultured Caudovirales phage TaxID=2100421 RepID=A0A6J5LG51_9CAUD|nr:hypothetical protein UFOVP134_27 [uncultured Caudovirales phage]
MALNRTKEHAERMAAFRKTWQHRVITAADANTPLGMVLRSAIFGTEIELAVGTFPLVLKGDIVEQDGDFYLVMTYALHPGDVRVDTLGKLDEFRTHLGRAMNKANLDNAERDQLEAHVRAWVQFDERNDDDRRATEVRAKLPKIGRFVYDRKEGWIPEPVAPPEG